MAQQIINIGATANDGTGDTLRESQRKNNENTSELYDSVALITPSFFKGVYLTESDLNTAHPTASIGDYAQVNEVGATDAVNYNWDAEENIWIKNSVAGSGATNTDALPEGTSNLYFTVARFLSNLTFSNIISALGFTPANDANVLHKTGDEAFAGIKSVSNSSSPATSAIELGNSYNGGISTSANAPFRLVNNLNGIGGHFNNRGIGIGLSGLNESVGTLLALNRSAGSTGDFLYLGTTGTEYFKVNYLGSLFMQGNLDVRNSFSYFGAQKGYTYIFDDQINSYYSTDADAILNINYAGYNNGLTRFRGLTIYNGKGTPILTLIGSTGVATFASSVTATAFNKPDGTPYVGILPVTETGTSFSLTDAHNGKVVILTASCTVTIPNGLIAGFEVSIVTLAGVTLTVAQGSSVVLFNNAGTTMAEKLSMTLKNRTATNQYITTGNI